MDPLKNYFCDRPKWYFELNDLIGMYTLIRILWEHNAQNVVVRHSVESDIVANKTFTVRGNSGSVNKSETWHFCDKLIFNLPDISKNT